MFEDAPTLIYDPVMVSCLRPLCLLDDLGRDSKADPIVRGELTSFSTQNYWVIISAFLKFLFR